MAETATNTWTERDPETGRHHRNGHLIYVDGCMWRCELCRHKFDAAVDADLFWCGEDCAGKHHGAPAPTVPGTAPGRDEEQQHG